MYDAIKTQAWGVSMTIKMILMICLLASTSLLEAKVRTIKGWKTRSCEHRADELSCVVYHDNYDGDTVTFDIPDLHPIMGDQISVRVYGIDAPEIRTKNDCEKALALEAKREVEELMLKAERIDLLKAQRGKYFRILAEVYVNGRSLSDHLIQEGLAVPYEGGTRPVVDWCKF